MEMKTFLPATFLLLVATPFCLVSGQITLHPVFDQSVYMDSEGGTIQVCMSMPELTKAPLLNLPCGFEVEVLAAPLPPGDPRNGCDFGVDYTLSTGTQRATVFFTQGNAASTCFDINLQTDGIVEGTEFFMLVVAGSTITGVCSGGGFTVLETATASISCSDSPTDVVVIYFDLKELRVSEGADPSATLTASAVGQYARPIDVAVVCNPTDAESVVPATSADFMFTSFRFQFSSVLQPNSTAANQLVIPIVDDDIAEPRESFICTLQSGSTQSVQTRHPEQVTVDIIDDDELVVQWDRDFYSFSESALASVELFTSSFFEISFTVIGVPSQITSGIITQQLPTNVFIPGFGFLTVPLNTVVFRGSTYGVASVAIGTGDVAQTRNAFIFSPGEANAGENFTHIRDSVCEYDELYMATFEFGQDVLDAEFNTREGQPNVTYIAIEDNDRTEVAFRETNCTVSEGVGHVNISVSSFGAFFGPLNVTVTCSPDTADGDDFDGGTYYTGFFTNRAASTLDSIPISIPIMDDTISESEECFVCRITDVEGLRCAVPGNNVEKRICIQDNDDVPDVEIYIDTTSHRTPEGNPVVPCPIRLSGLYPHPISVTIELVPLDGVSPCNLATGEVDFVSNVFPIDVVIPANTLILNTSFIVIDDLLLECNEAFGFALTYNADQPGVSLRPGSSSGNVTIVDDDECRLGFRTERTIVNEDVGSVEIFVDATCAASFEYCFSVQLGDISTTFGVDYTAVGQVIELCIPAGNTSASFVIDVTDDEIYEANEMATATIIVLSSLATRRILLGTPGLHRITIFDNDDLEVCFSDSPPNFEVMEGDKVDIALKTNREFSVPFCVTLTTSDGSAVAPGDYMSLMMTINFNVGLQTAMAMVMTHSDTVNEGDENLFVTLAIPADASKPPRISICEENRGMILVKDVPVPEVKVCWESANISVFEDSGTASVNVIVTGNHSFPLEVGVVCRPNTADVIVDFLAPLLVPVIIPAGGTSHPFSVLIVDNLISELRESFTCELVLSDAVKEMGVSVCEATPTVTVEIIDNDALVCGFTQGSLMVKEDAGQVTKVVTCNTVAQYDFSLTATTVSDTAIDGSDFVGRTSTLSFPSGSRNASLTVIILDDNVVEMPETFVCELSASEDLLELGFTLDAAASIVNIMDNDVSVMFTNSEVFVSESSLSVTVDLTSMGFISGDAYNVLITAVGGTATGEVDYTGVAWTVEFATGVSDTSFTIPIICDQVGDEGDETIILMLEVASSAQSRVAVGSVAIMTINIIDDCDSVMGTGDGDSVNDTVIADPVYTVPLLVSGGNHSFVSGTPLCYEIHGETGRTFNLISDECTSVNAFYESARNPAAGNVITSIGVVATDRTTTTTASVNVTEDGDCFTVVDGDQALPPGEYTLGVIRVRVDPGCVRITVPNCGGQELVYWVRCRIRSLSFDDESGSQMIDQEMIKFVVGRGLGLNPSSHGLIAQFWGVPVDINPYTGFWVPSSEVPPSNRWNVTMAPAQVDSRSFAAVLYPTTWTEDTIPVIPNTPCLFAGDSQGGPLGEARHHSLGPVIEGHYTEYICKDGIFDTSFTYSKYSP